jgi:sec1 family domain-containing protein 1
MLSAEVLLRMLALHAPPAPGGAAGGNELYKVLVMDRACRDVVAPLLRLAELRGAGVTLHLLLEQERQPIPDVPAVYFISATQENVERVAADACAGLYESLHVCFAGCASARLLEQLAAAAVRGGGIGRIARLWDEYACFTSLEPSLFSLGLRDAYVSLNDPSAKDSIVEVKKAY